MVDVGEPNNTIYIKNLNEKYSKARMLDELKTILRKKFSTYGEVVDIVALSNFYSKGQAFVVFKELEAAKKVDVDLKYDVMAIKDVKRLLRLRRRAKIKANNALRAKR